VRGSGTESELVKHADIFSRLLLRNVMASSRRRKVAASIFGYVEKALYERGDGSPIRPNLILAS
jgi:hypothetical protein